MVKYRLYIEDEDTSIVEYMKECNELNLKTLYFHGLEVRHGWLGYYESMKQLSKRFPTVLFNVYIHDKVCDTYFLHYWKSGKAQFTKGWIEYLEFDENEIFEVD